MRRFIAGFASVTTFSCSKVKEFPFAEDRFAIEQDKYEVVCDRELATFKIKQNERK
jgi:hypothetical protein